MAIAFVQTSPAISDAGVNSTSVVFGSTTGAGNFLVLPISVWTGGTPPNSTPSGLGTWNTPTSPGVRNGSDAFLSYNHNCTAGTTVTVDYGTAYYAAGIAAEFSGLATTSSIDVQTTNTATSTTPTSGTTGTTTQADELVLVVCHVSVGATNIEIDVPATTGYTNLHVQQNAQDYDGHSSDYKIISATGTQSAAWGTLGGSYDWGAKIATFKQASGGGGGAAQQFQMLLGMGH